MSIHTAGYYFEVENFSNWNNGVSRFYYYQTVNTNEHVYSFSYNSAAITPSTDYETIVYKTNQSAWYDYDGSSNPFSLTTTNGVTEGTDSSGTLMMKWGHSGYPDPTDSGPTVTSITDDTVVVPSDTISNTDFTLLKNGSAYANSNISVTLGTFDPADTPRFYDYTLTLNGSGSYRRTIDSKSYEAFEYDTSWISSPSSGRSTSYNKILNVLATIPSSTSITSGNNALTCTFSNNGRVLTHTYNATIGSVATTIDIIFLVEQRTVNNVSEICGFFYEIHTANSIRNAWTSSPLYIIGAQATMSYTQNLSGVATIFSVSDWVHSNEPEGDAYPVTESTASNGGGKPDRYPLIMTNLFNRNRSLYSIGMTHKDTWDLFL